MDAKHDVLVIGAGCAGMRAAIAAYDAGADVAIVSKLHPTRSHSGAAEGGINAALGNAAEDNPEIHTFDTVKGSDYLGDQDSIEIFCREAPGDIYQLEHWGAVFSRAEDGRLAQRPFGAAGSPRTVYAADITGHVLIQVLYEQVVKRDITVYEEYFAWQLVIERRPLPGRDRVGPPARRAEGDRRQDDRPRDGRRRPALPRDDERVRLHRRRDGDGAARRAAAEGHGVHAVPPDDDVPERDPDHRGLPRRGRHTCVNSEGERFMERYAPNAKELASRDVVSRSEQTEIDEGRGINGSVLLDLRHLGAERILDAAARARASWRWPTPASTRSTSRSPSGPGAHYHMGGVETDTDGLTELTGLYAAGEVRVRLGPRREPPRRQLADGDDHLRPPRRHRRRRVGAREHDVDVPESAERDAERELKELLGRTSGERPWQIRDELGQSMLRELRRLPARGADVAADRDHREPARALPERRSSRTRATSSTAT